MQVSRKGSRKGIDARELHAQLEGQVAALVSSEEWAAMLETAARFHSYSFRNVMLIRMQRPDATRVAGFRRWKELGRYVRRGERGIAILAPVTYTRKVQADDYRRETDADDGVEVRVLRGFKRAYVFDIAQTEGADIPDVLPTRLEGDAPQGLWDALAEQVAAAGYRLERVASCSNPGALGETDYAVRTVRVREDLQPAQACKTLAHELAHVVMHEPGSGCREAVEVEAESVAYIVSRACGLDSGSYTFAYVARWAGGDAKLISATAERVTETARRILESMPEQEKGEPLALSA